MNAKIVKKIAGIGLVTIALGLPTWKLYTIEHDNKHRTIVENTDENNKDDVENTNENIPTFEEQLTEQFTNYYNNTDDVYPKDIDVNLTLRMLDMTYEQIEDIHGDKVPTAVELEKLLMLGFAQEFYNVTQSTTDSYISTIFSNKVEKEVELKLREDIAFINEQAINKSLNAADADNYKQMLIKIFTDKSIYSDEDYYYSDGFKAFVANVFCPAYNYSANKNGFTELEAKLYGSYLASYECKVLADKLNGDRDQALVQHGKENPVGTPVPSEEALINRLISTITQLDSYKSIKFINSVNDIASLGARTETPESNKSNNNSSNKSSREEVSKSDMTKDDKKQAEAGKKEIEEQNKEDNKTNKDKAKDRSAKIEAAIQTVVDGLKKIDGSEGYVGVERYIYVNLSEDGRFDPKSDKDVAAVIRGKAESLIRIADSKTKYNIFNDAYSKLYDKKGNMTARMEGIVVTSVNNALVEYNKHNYGLVTPTMVQEIGKFLGISDLESHIRDMNPGLIQTPGVTIVPSTEGTYDPSSTYHYDENGNKVYDTPVTPTTGATPTPSSSHEENGITYYEIPTPTPITFGSNSNEVILASYSSVNNAQVINSIANALDYAYGKQAALSYLTEVKGIIRNCIEDRVKTKEVVRDEILNYVYSGRTAVSNIVKNYQAQEMNGIARSKC